MVIITQVLRVLTAVIRYLIFLCGTQYTLHIKFVIDMHIGILLTTGHILFASDDGKAYHSSLFSLTRLEIRLKNRLLIKTDLKIRSLKDWQYAGTLLINDDINRSFDNNTLLAKAYALIKGIKKLSSLSLSPVGHDLRKNKKKDHLWHTVRARQKT